jgi:hypothetical protein
VDVEQAVRRDRLGLALERQLDALALDVVADEGVRDLADQDLVRGRVLLEPGGDVDRVAGREVHRRVLVGVGDDLAGVDAGPDRQPDAVEPLELLVEACSFWTMLAAAGRPGARRPRGPGRARRRP